MEAVGIASRAALQSSARIVGDGPSLWDGRLPFKVCIHSFASYSRHRLTPWPVLVGCLTEMSDVDV